MGDSAHPIRVWRQAQKPPVSLLALATKVGISKPSLSRIETGDQEMSPAIAKKLSKLTGIPMRNLCPDLAKLFEAAE